MGLHRGIDGSEPVRPEGDRRGAALHLVTRSARVASGTLACPACDAPVAPGPVPLSPTDVLSCPYCLRSGAVRDFLSLVAPSRPARVEVRVVARRQGIRSR